MSYSRQKESRIKYFVWTICGLILFAMLSFNLIVFAANYQQYNSNARLIQIEKAFQKQAEINQTNQANFGAVKKILEENDLIKK